MTAQPDYYAVLGVSPDSEDIVIQAAYRALMRRYHPDKNPSAEAARKTIEINAAYSVLGDTPKRAAYDGQRPKHGGPTKDSASSRKSSSPPPPPPPPPPPRRDEAKSGANGDQNSAVPKSRAAVFATVGVIVIATLIGISATSQNRAAAANNSMNVDENLTTTDMNLATTDMNATEMNADAALNEAAMAAANEGSPDENLTGAVSVPTSLASQQQSAVSYSTIENAADHFASILVARGIIGARAFSESCHKDVQAGPTWDGADSCAAFDYAAAYLDDAVSRNSGAPLNGYFQFQRANQDDNYAAVGAASWTTTSRLSKIRQAAESAAADAVRTQIWRQQTIARMKASESPPSGKSSVGNSSD